MSCNARGSKVGFEGSKGCLVAYSHNEDSLRSAQREGGGGSQLPLVFYPLQHEGYVENMTLRSCVHELDVLAVSLGRNKLYLPPSCG